MKITQKQQWLHEEQICIAQGQSTALNLMFETQQDHQSFLLFWKKYLGKMAELIQYQFSPTSWTLLFKTKSAEDILQSYYEQRKKSKKTKEYSTLSETSKILSEHFRIFLSQYVRHFNATHKRQGTLVLKRFNKRILPEEDHLGIFNKMVNQIKVPHQKNKKYTADERSYDKQNSMQKGSIWQGGNKVIQKLLNTMAQTLHKNGKQSKKHELINQSLPKLSIANVSCNSMTYHFLQQIIQSKALSKLTLGSVSERIQLNHDDIANISTMNRITRIVNTEDKGIERGKVHGLWLEELLGNFWLSQDVLRNLQALNAQTLTPKNAP